MCGYMDYLQIKIKLEDEIGAIIQYLSNLKKTFNIKKDYLMVSLFEVPTKNPNDIREIKYSWLSLPEIEQEGSFLQVEDELLKVILIGQPAIEL